MPPAGVVIPAGGTGSRMGGGLPKQFLPLKGIPILVRSCQAFLDLDCIRYVAVAVPAGQYQQASDLLQRYLSAWQSAKLRITTGGATRQESVAAGLCQLPPDIELVLVHDAARPLVDRELILRCLQSAEQHGAAIAAVPVRDTLKRVSASGGIEATVDRRALWQAQTPQAARRDLLEQALAKAGEQGLTGTDEASLLEAAGIAVSIAEGSRRNLKITYPEDLRAAALFLEERQDKMKIGHGFDAHRLVAGRKLILGGVQIDFDLGLAGHSDADVVTHALIDALLGALGEGDIGRHFPDSDPRYKGINSLLLLEQTMRLVRERGFAIGNADISILCQRPKLAPHITAMRANLARGCHTVPEEINIKATTTEQMGYTGRGEGIAAHAVVLLKGADDGYTG